MIEELTHELITDQRHHKKMAQGRGATVRSAVNAIAQRRSVVPRQAVKCDTGLPTLWLLRAAKCDCAAVALCIKMIPGSAIGVELSIPGYVFRRWMKTTERTIAALERLRNRGLVSWRQNGDAFKIVPHLH